MQPNCCCSFSTHNMRVREPHTQCPRRSSPPYVSPTRRSECYCQSRCDVSVTRPSRRKRSRATGQRHSSTNFENEGRPTRVEIDRSGRNRKADEGRGDSRFMGFPKQLQLHPCIPPEFNFAIPKRRQLQPLPESHCPCTYCRCSCDNDDLYEDADVGCCCEYYEQELSDEGTESVYDSVAEDPCCVCECKACLGNKRRTHKQKGRGEKKEAARRSRESSPSFDSAQDPAKNTANRDSATQSVHSSFQNDPSHHKGQRGRGGSGSAGPDASNSGHKEEDPRSLNESRGSPSHPSQTTILQKKQGSHESQEQGVQETSNENVSPTLTRLSSNDPMFHNLFGHLVPQPTGFSHNPESEYEAHMSKRQTLEEDYRTGGMLNIGQQHVLIASDNQPKARVNNVKPKSCMKHTCPYRARGGSAGQHQPKAHHQGEEREMATVNYEDLGKKESHNTSHNSCSRKSCKFKDLEDKERQPPREDVQKQPRSSCRECKCLECFRKCAMACGKKDCTICSELLKKLEEHKQKQKDDGNRQGHGFDQGPGQGPRRGTEKMCTNSKCKNRKHSEKPEPEPQPSSSEATQAATLTGSKSSSGEVYITPDQDSDPSIKETKSAQSPSPSPSKPHVVTSEHDNKRCINPQCYPGSATKHVPGKKTPESRSFDVTQSVEGHGNKRCINPQCNPGNTAKHVSGKKTPESRSFDTPLVEDHDKKRCINPQCYPKHDPEEKTLESELANSTSTVEDVTAVKEHLELKEHAFRQSPRSNNVLAPQEERTPKAYFPPDTEQYSASATCYVLKRNPPDAYSLGLNQNGCSDESDFPSTPNCAFFSTGRMYGGLAPVEEMSKEESETTCDTLTKASNDSRETKASADSKSAKTLKVDTQISTNKGSSTMTFNVGVQYPSNMEVESTGKRDQGVYVNVKQVASSTKQNGRTDGKKCEYKRAWVKRTIVSKSRRCLVHSYPLVNRKVSPNRAASPKI